MVHNFPYLIFSNLTATNMTLQTFSSMAEKKIIQTQGRGPKKKCPFQQSFTTKGSGAPPPLVVPWAIKILGPYFNVAVDALGPETDFTLEKKNRKNERKTTENS